MNGACTAAFPASFLTQTPGDPLSQERGDVEGDADLLVTTSAGEGWLGGQLPATGVKFARLTCLFVGMAAKPRLKKLKSVSGNQSRPGTADKDRRALGTGDPVRHWTAGIDDSIAAYDHCYYVLATSGKMRRQRSGVTGGP